MVEFLDRQVQRIVELIVHTGKLTGPWQTQKRNHVQLIQEFYRFEMFYGKTADSVSQSAFTVLMEESEKVVAFIRKDGMATMFLRTNRTLLDDDTCVMLNKLYGYVHTPKKIYVTEMKMPQSILPNNVDTMHVWCITKSLHSDE